MAKTIVTGRMEARFGTQYVTDYLAQKNITTRMIVPKTLEGATEDQLAGIMQAGGSTVKSVAGNPFGAGFKDLACRDTNQITPRAVVLIFENGSTMSVPLRENSNGAISITARIQTVIDAVKQISNISPIVCVALRGERAFGIQGDFPANPNMNADPIAVTVASNYYSGVAQYESDEGETIALPFKILSERENQPPASIEIAWSNCVGDLTDSGSFSCGSVTARYNHRRFIVDFITDSLYGGQGVIDSASHEIPVLKLDNAVVCGDAIRQELEKSIFCLTYVGESDNRIDQSGQINLQ